MKPLLAVLRLELGRWKNLLAVAALGGFMPLLAYLAPGIPDHLRGEICDGAAVIGAVSLALVTVISAGFGRLGDATQRAFLLRRGVPGWVVWLGPALAVWAAALAAIFLAILPATILGRGLALPVLGELMLWLGQVSLEGPLRWLLNVGDDPYTKVMPDLSESGWRGWHSTWPILAMAAFLASLQQLAAFLGTAMRDRSLRLMLDLLALPTVVLAFAWATTRLLEHGAVAEWLLGLGILAAATLVAGLVGAACSTHIGRSDPAGSHMGWSLGLWTTLLLGVGAIGLRAHWALDVHIEDLERLEHVQMAPAGPWAWVQGPARGRLDLDAKVLVNLETGRSLALGTIPFGHEFSSSGEHAAWLVQNLGQDRVTMQALDLTDPDSRPREVSSELSWAGADPPWIQALADDGSIAAIDQDDRLVIIDMAQGTVLAMEPPNRRDAVWRRMAAFEHHGRVSIHGHIMQGSADARKRVGLEVATLSWEDGSFEVQGRHSLGEEVLMHHLRMDTERERALVLMRKPRRAWLLDARTAQPIREVVVPGLAPRDFVFLADGDFVVVAGQKPSDEDYEGDAVATVQRFDRDGEPVGAPFTYAPGGYKAIGGQPSADTLVLCGIPTGQGPWKGMRRLGYHCHLADLDTGRTTSLGPRLWPMGYMTIIYSSDGTPPAVGAPATRLFLDPEGQLLWLDLDTRSLVPATVPLGS
jgi:hypothetical protein